MKQLYLLRHAHSREKELGQTDKMRDLSPIGLGQCAVIGGFLVAHNYNVAQIISSDAQRAMATATLVAEKIGYPTSEIIFDAEIYRASIPTFLNCLRQQEPGDHILLVGHNPTVSYLAEYFTDEDIGEVPPGTLMVLRAAVDKWGDLAKGKMQLMSRFVPD